MGHLDIDVAMQALDASARIEYGANFIEAIDTPDEVLTMRRTARLTGIEMKRPFAAAAPIVGPSETNANQRWLLNQQFAACSGPEEPAFDALRSDPSYELTVKIYNELRRQENPDTRGMSFGSFLHDNHSESNWLLAAMRAAQPYICDRPEITVESPTSPETRRELWELGREAAGDMVSEGVKKAVEPVCGLLCAMVPFLSAAPPAFVFGFSIFVVHFARRGFCNAQFQQEMITTLRWNQQ